VQPLDPRAAPKRQATIPPTKLPLQWFSFSPPQLPNPMLPPRVFTNWLHRREASKHFRPLPLPPDYAGRFTRFAHP
jgi:hypothetical protein